MVKCVRPVGRCFTNLTLFWLTYTGKWLHCLEFVDIQILYMVYSHRRRLADSKGLCTYMTIQEKLNMDYDGLNENGPITIVALGDSVTHGAVGWDEINYETGYWNRLRRKIHALRNYVPVNVINAGIGGTTAMRSLPRMERDVFSHHPDLVILCFGLNDVCFSFEEYTQALAQMFDACNERHIPAIFMTPNMLNTYVTEDTPEELRGFAADTARLQNDGTMDRYMQAACRVAQEREIPVCDCYALWKKRSETEDTTRLLANGINHPLAEMHELFADALFRQLFPDAVSVAPAESTLCREAQ